VKAARTLYRGVNGAGVRVRVPASYHHCGRHGPYTRLEVAEALLLCRRVVKDWPSEWEFQEWARLTRLLARERGLPTPRLPSPRQVRNLFGDFPRAVEWAKRDPRAALVHP
jgi:hypothetical protein